MIKRNDPTTVRAWAFYDWANSVYPLVITTSIFPIFYEAKTSSVLDDGSVMEKVRFFGLDFINTELYSYVLSLSFLIVSFLSPILSGIADYSGRKKSFLKIFCYLGASGCALLFFFDPAYLELSMVFVLMASVGFWGSLVFYNAFLPEIAEPQLHDRVSAQGFAYGYLGSALLLIALLILIQTETMPAHFAFPLVAIWWAGFAQVTYHYLPDNVYDRKPVQRHMFAKGFQELRNVWNDLSTQFNLKAFLRSFFVYSMGVQTVMLMAVLFAKKEVDWGDGGDAGLIVSILIIQFVAILGAYLFAQMSKRVGNIKVLAAALVIWVGVCFSAYFISTPAQFYILAAVVGLVMGGIQALSRSTYSKLIPETLDHASYFSFYDVVEKLGIVIGTLLFGLIEGVTSSMRNSALALLVFFLVGLILLLFVKKDERIAPLSRTR
ncbi:MAG: MFS transporter [Flavobacteriales bacterium]|nr:MFS transporter [Flavobacteriales bacterium]